MGTGLLDDHLRIGLLVVRSVHAPLVRVPNCSGCRVSIVQQHSEWGSSAPGALESPRGQHSPVGWTEDRRAAVLDWITVRVQDAIPVIAIISQNTYPVESAITVVNQTTLAVRGVGKYCWPHHSSRDPM